MKKKDANAIRNTRHKVKPKDSPLGRLENGEAPVEAKKPARKSRKKKQRRPTGAEREEIMKRMGTNVEGQEERATIIDTPQTVVLGAERQTFEKVFPYALCAVLALLLAWVVRKMFGLEAF